MNRRVSTAPALSRRLRSCCAVLAVFALWLTGGSPAFAQSPFQSAPGPMQAAPPTAPRHHAPRSRSDERDDQDTAPGDESDLPAPTAALGPPEPPSEITEQFAVRGTAMPWPWQINGLNGGFSYGYGDGTPATLVGYNIFRFRSGDKLTIRYASGAVKRGPAYPGVDANGYAGFVVTDGRVSYVDLPSKYVGPREVNLMRLIGVFATLNGEIIGRPFLLGNGPITLTVPNGATELLLGFNNDHFNENSGEIAVSITGLKQVPGGPNH